LQENHGFRLILHIIESPSPNDIFDARTEGSVLRESLRVAGIAAQYNIAVNIAKFHDALDLCIQSQADEPDTLLVLHLSMHGNESGVELTDGSFLYWQQMSDVLRHVAQGKLLLCMSSCFGFSGCRMALDDGGVYPFLGIIGHRGKANLSDLAVGYAAFYHRLFMGSLIPTAVEAMRKASGDDRFSFISAKEVREIYQRGVSRTQAERARRQLEAYLRTILSQNLDGGSASGPDNPGPQADA
jgi:hypothetical protein